MMPKFAKSVTVSVRFFGARPPISAEMNLSPNRFSTLLVGKGQAEGQI